jgi:N-acetyl-anhydromuramyl-L-alanine amidase AmpD
MKPVGIVIHVMEGTLLGTDAWFAKIESQVSAHYGVGKKGAVHQYVREEDTACHVGVVDRPAWPLLQRKTNGKPINPNLYTVGIEHEGHDGERFTDAQYQASAALIRDICTRWQIPIDELHIVPHHAIRASKPCPGSGVDIAKLIAMAKVGK